MPRRKPRHAWIASRSAARSAAAVGVGGSISNDLSFLVVRHQRLHDAMRHMMDARFRSGMDDVRDLARWDDRLCIREVASLPDIVSRFSARSPFRYRVAAGIAGRLVPQLARAYQLCRVEIRG